VKLTKIFPVLATAGILALLAIAIPANPALAARSIELASEKGQIGDDIDVDGAGWPVSVPEDQIENWVDVYFTSEEASAGDYLDDDITVYQQVKENVTTDYYGGFWVSFEVPPRLTDGGEDVRGGTYYVCVTKQNSKKILAVAEFTVTAGTITLDHDDGVVGTEVGITGEDFAEEEEITIYYDGDELDSDYIVECDDDGETDSRGDMACTIIIPPSAAGDHTILVTDESISDAEAEFTVHSAAAVSPTHAPPGDEVKVSGSGFDSKEDVTITIDGEEVATKKAFSYGSFTTTFTVPELDEGTYDIEADDGSNTVELEFTVDIGTVPFYIESEKPGIPVLLVPKDGGKAPARASFDWGDVTNPSLPITYTLQIASDEAFSSILLEAAGLSLSEHTLPEGTELPKTTGEAPYYWRVRATDAAANVGDWSAPDSFHVGGVSLPGGGWLIHLWWGLGAAGGAFLGYYLGKRRAYNY